MPRTARIVGNSGFYHIVSRGNGKQILFEEDADYLFFLKLLKKTRQEEDFSILAYCLMENHFHLLLKIGTDMGRIMKRICTTYALYFNEKYEHVGHLFQGRYKSVPVESDAALMSVVRYIHNNPVKAGICMADQYRWSSWRSYIRGNGIAETDLVLGLAGGTDGFRAMSMQEDDSEHLEFRERRRLSDRAAREIIRNKLNLESGIQIKAMNRNSRDPAIRRLKQEGLSVRQIERLTGINRGTVQRVTEGTSL